MERHVITIQSSVRVVDLVGEPGWLRFSGPLLANAEMNSQTPSIYEFSLWYTKDEVNGGL